MSELLEKSGLQQVLSRTAEDVVARFTGPLQAELPKYAIVTAYRQAHFIAQVAHESGGFNHLVENLNYSAKALRTVFGKYFPTEDMAEQYARQPEMIANVVYADRMGNGNTESGDGWKYRGRGLIQLTGKDNYQKCSEFVGVDLLNEPDRLAQDATIAVAAACWYWDSRNLNNYAEEDDIITITKRINGGLHGLQDREQLLGLCKGVLGIA